MSRKKHLIISVLHLSLNLRGVQVPLPRIWECLLTLSCDFENLFCVSTLTPHALLQKIIVVYIKV